MEGHEEREMEILLDEIPHATTSPLLRRHRLDGMHGHSIGGSDDGELPPVRMPPNAYGQGRVCLSPPPLVSDGGGSYSSSSSSWTGSMSDRLSPVVGDAGGDRIVEDPGLLLKLRDMHLGGNEKAAAAGLPFPFAAAADYSVALSALLDDYDVDAYFAKVGNLLPSALMFDVDERPCAPGMRRHCPVDGKVMTPWLENCARGPPEFGVDGVLGRSRCYQGSLDGVHQWNVTNRLPAISEPFLTSYNGVDVNSDHNASNSLMTKNYDYAIPNGFGLSNRLPLQPIASMRNLRDVEGSDKSILLQGKGVQCAGEHWGYDSKEGQKSEFGHPQPEQGMLSEPNFSPTSPLKYTNFMGLKGCIYYMAKDQQGCRSLQRKIDEGKHMVDTIFNGVIDHAVELMVHPFGNYLMQKLLDVCSEEQRMKILLVLTKDPADLVRISLSMHGTRAVQKLIDTLKTRQQIALVVSALQPMFLDLIKDLNGNHVVQHCLESFSEEDNEFIFDAAAKYCVEIATHRHGCCVLQRCIDHSTRENRAKLISEISVNGLLLAQDPFGNYVIQYILKLKSPLVNANLASHLEGKYVRLSAQKFSSNVVEKCLKYFCDIDRSTIILELLSVSPFEQLLQDPYANYVIQSALVNSKGSLHSALVEAIRPHAAVLKTSPYCKRIFSRGLLKKGY